MRKRFEHHLRWTYSNGDTTPGIHVSRGERTRDIPYPTWTEARTAILAHKARRCRGKTHSASSVVIHAFLIGRELRTPGKDAQHRAVRNGAKMEYYYRGGLIAIKDGDVIEFGLTPIHDSGVVMKLGDLFGYASATYGIVHLSSWTMGGFFSRAGWGPCVEAYPVKIDIKANKILTPVNKTNYYRKLLGARSEYRREFNKYVCSMFGPIPDDVEQKLLGKMMAQRLS